MAIYDLTRLDLSDLDQPLARHLLTVGEPLHVERKRDLPTPEQLSELLGSMANTEGGWAVLGVEDNGTIVGLPTSRADLQDELRDRVRQALDPLPNFAARRLNIDGLEVGFIRVYRSEDTPHVSTHKGAPYIREPGGKRPVDSRRELDMLVARGRSSDADALARLRSSTTAATALNAPELNGASSYEAPSYREWVLRAAPLGLDPNFATRARTQAVKEATEASAKVLLPRLHGYAGDEYTQLQAVGAGWITWGLRVGDGVAAAVVVDPAGVATAVVRERGVRSLINVEPEVDSRIVPMLRAAIAVFGAAGVSGRFMCDLHARGFAGVMLQAQRQGAVHMAEGTHSSQAHGVSGSAATGELQAVAKRLMADVAADTGLLMFAP